MNYRKFLHQKFRVARNMVLKRPILAVYDVTKLCNERCPMCNIWKTESDDMSLDEIEIRARDLEVFGIGYVFLQGGDPLMRNDIVDIIDIFLNHGIRPTVITNAIRLTPEIAEAIAARPCNLAISIDSLNPELYRQLRGVDTLSIVKDNIERIDYLRRKHKGSWSITTTVTKLTDLSDVKAMICYAEDHGFMYAIRPYITVEGAAGKRDETLVYKSSDVIKIFEYLLKKAYKENYLAAMMYEEHIKYIKGVRPMPQCDALNYSFCVNEKGIISPCLELPNLNLPLEQFDEYKHKYQDILNKCNCETPCFYGCAREIGVLWRKKWRILFRLPIIITQMVRYGNFF